MGDHLAGRVPEKVLQAVEETRCRMRMPCRHGLTHCGEDNQESRSGSVMCQDLQI